MGLAARGPRQTNRVTHPLITRNAQQPEGDLSDLTQTWRSAEHKPA